MNRVVLSGRLTRDPELRYSNSAEPLAVASYGLAVDRRVKAEGQQDVDFIDCRVFGKSAEFANKYFKKGMLVAVSGRLQINRWEDQNGQKRTTTVVVVDDQEFGESKTAFENRVNRGQNDDYAQEQQYSQSASGYGQQSAAPSSMPKPAQNTGGFMPIEESIDDDDLPF